MILLLLFGNCLHFFRVQKATLHCHSDFLYGWHVVPIYLNRLRYNLKTRYCWILVHGRFFFNFMFCRDGLLTFRPYIPDDWRPSLNYLSKSIRTLTLETALLDLVLNFGRKLKHSICFLHGARQLITLGFI